MSLPWPTPESGQLGLSGPLPNFWIRSKLPGGKEGYSYLWEAPPRAPPTSLVFLLARGGANACLLQNLEDTLQKGISSKSSLRLQS